MIFKFSRYREFTIGDISCWYDRKDRTYCSIMGGKMLVYSTEKDLRKGVAMALRMAV